MAAEAFQSRRIYYRKAMSRKNITNRLRQWIVTQFVIQSTAGFEVITYDRFWVITKESCDILFPNILEGAAHFNG
jgi:hypothetical protein